MQNKNEKWLGRLNVAYDVVYNMLKLGHTFFLDSDT